MTKCKACGKSVYFNDPKIVLGGNTYHSACATCDECGKKLSLSNFATSGERLLCKTHFKAEFSTSGGKYAGDEKFLKGSRSRSYDSGDEPVSSASSADGMSTESSAP